MLKNKKQHAGFWAELPRPIVALSPMDGVTNAPFRQICQQFGGSGPDVSFTEFVPVDGLMHKATRLLRDFEYDICERPVVAQVYGSNPNWFYACAHLVCEMGFDGIDINMGCPAKKVEQRGAGAGLIRSPHLAQEIIKSVQRGVHDWCDGQSPERAGVPGKVVRYAHDWMNSVGLQQQKIDERIPLPVTVKTRIGYDSCIIADWIRYLLDTEPVVISIHGRTLKQMYRGEADWDAIAQAAEIVHSSGAGTILLGNGDVNDSAIAVERLRASGADGVLLGRGAIGNPWIFRECEAIRYAVNNPHSDLLIPFRPTLTEVIEVMIAHAQAIDKFAPHHKHPKAFTQFFRTIKPYTAGFPGASEKRQQIFLAKTAPKVIALLENWKNETDPSLQLAASA